MNPNLKKKEIILNSDKFLNFVEKNVKKLISNSKKANSEDTIAAEFEFILRDCLKEFGIEKTNLDTQGFRDLINLVNQTCNDTWELYTDLQTYNPYTDKMIKKLKKSLNKMEKLSKGDQND